MTTGCVLNVVKLAISLSQERNPMTSPHSSESHPVEKPKKKGGCLKWGAIILGIIIVIAIISSLAGGGDDDKGTSDTSNEQNTAQQESPAEDNEQQPAEEQNDDQDVPKEYKNALKKAETYAKYQHMSQTGIYNQLTSEFESFSPEAAQYAIDNVEADWNQNALEKAKDYFEMQAMSPDAVYDQLTSEFEGFTPEQAQYAVDNLNQ